MEHGCEHCGELLDAHDEMYGVCAACRAKLAEAEDSQKG